MQREAAARGAQAPGSPGRAVFAQRDRLAAVQCRSSGQCAECGGDGETGQRGLVVGERGVGRDGVIHNDALATQQREDARPRDLQHVGNVVVGEAGQRVERQLAALLVFGEHPIQRQRVEVRIQPQIARDPLHGGDRAALAALDAVRPEAASVEAEHRVDEGAAHRARELAVVGEPRPQLERQRQHPLAQRRSGRQDVLDEIRGRGGHASARTRWTEAAALARAAGFRASGRVRGEHSTR